MARYDGLARWYDDYISGHAGPLTDLVGTIVARLLDEDAGWCLDLGCGTGAFFPVLRAGGRSVVGIDVSADQLGVAQERIGDSRVALVQADAARLPFADGSFDAVVSVLMHTDVPDFAEVLAESHRVLRAEGQLVFIGTHPCFASPVVERLASGERMLHAGYRKPQWHFEDPGLGDGIRSRVGAHHVPLAELITAVLEAGFALETFEEPGNDDPPTLIALTARATAK